MQEFSKNIKHKVNYYKSRFEECGTDLSTKYGAINPATAWAGASSPSLSPKPGAVA